MAFIVYCAICRKSFYTNEYRESYWCESCIRREQESYERATKK
jgi:uncharacterized CHY-type Zn-finger protein